MMEKKYNLVFIGTPAYSVPSLEALFNDERFKIAAVITAPDVKIGRRQIITPPPVKQTAQKFKLKILQPKILTRAVADELRALHLDAIVTIAYGKIIPEFILNIPKYGCFNLHASLLPKYRGAAPIQAAIAAGEKQTGVTLMQMDAGIDTGPIIAQEACSVIENETGASLHDKLALLSAQVAIKFLEPALRAEIKPKNQTNQEATMTAKITRADGKIDWQQNATVIERLTRAYYPWPGTWSLFNNQILKIIAVDQAVLNINKYQVGEMFIHQNNIAVQCGHNAIGIQTLQLQGKKPMRSEKFLRGYKNILPTILK